MPDATATFHRLVGDLEYPMFIVTAACRSSRSARTGSPAAWCGRRDAGDHDAFLLEPVAGDADPGVAEFSFHRAKRIEAGHEA